MTINIIPNSLGNDRILNKDLLSQYSVKIKDYLLLRENLLKKYRKYVFEKKVRKVLGRDISALVAYHRRFSSLDRHETEIRNLLQKTLIDLHKADYFRLVFYLVRGPIARSTSILFKTGWPKEYKDAILAMKVRYFLLHNNEDRLGFYLQQVARKPAQLRYLYPWIFYIPFEYQHWRLLYFLKSEIWPKVVESLDSNEVDKPFFDYITGLNETFPFVPFDTKRLLKAPSLYSALKILLMIKWVEALYFHQENELSNVMIDLEYYFPNSLPYLRAKLYQAEKSGNQQLFRRIMASLKIHDPHYWRNPSSVDVKLRKTSTWSLASKLLGIYDIYKFLGKK